MKLTIWVLVAAALLFGGYYWYSQSGAKGAVVDAALAQQFMEQMTLVPDGQPMPIEGYDAGLLMGRYPGLVVGDFVGVAAFEGVYSVENGAVVFTRTQEQPISSAERTISVEGYGTLLANLGTRLGMPIGSEEDVSAIIARVAAVAEPLSLTTLSGEWVSIDDPKFTRTFYENGGYLDAYEGSPEASVNGPWVSFTKENAPEGFPYPTEEGAVYLQLDGADEPLYFKVTKLTDLDLEMVYLNRGGALRFARVPEGK